MIDEKTKNNNDSSLSWHFWFLVSFSLFLIVTFVFYLPLRFEHQTPRDMDGRMMKEEPKIMMEDKHNGKVEHNQNIYHEESEVREGLAVNFNITPVPTLVNIAAKLDFFFNTKPGNIPIPAQKLQVEHTKLMHVIGVRSDLNEFFHIHPNPDPTVPGILSTNHIFNKPGLYKIWSEIKKDGAIHSFGHPEISVGGEGARDEKSVSFGRNVIAGNYQVSLKINEPVGMGREAHLSFDIHTLTGREINTEDYLGAAMHLTVIKDDLKRFIHTHPEEERGHGMFRFTPTPERGQAPLAPGEVSPRLVWGFTNQALGHVEDASEQKLDMGIDEVIEFHIVFPEAGLYKMFAQFRPQGIDLPPDETITVSFWMDVKEKIPIGVSPRLLIFIVSAILTAILSWVVARYLKVKPPIVPTQEIKTPTATG